MTIGTLPDGQTVQTSYSGSVVTATDQVNRKIKRETDGLGRLVKVTEQDAAGALTQDTSYSYNLLDALTLVNQGNQTRSFSYDALGRLLYERIPEQTATINDGTGTYWTTKYTYTDFSAVATRKDARGVVFTYDYDNLNRLRTIIPNTTNAPGVAPGGGAGFTYDNNNGSPSNGLLLSAGNETYSYYGYGRLASITRDIDGINYTTSYQYGAGNLRSQITYPSGRVLNINRSSTGRLNSLTEQYGPNYASSISYYAAGQVTGLTLGNGVAETYGYDANRLQLTSQTATKSGGPQNGLMNLTYNYQATAGQMGAATTAGNAGQLMSISGTINSTTESAAYTYDNLGRLVTSNQNSNGSSAQRRFAYDRWGNRAGMWDAVSGGNQIQSVVLQQSGSVPTNQLQSVTTSGVTKNYSYDAAGNVTNDGIHTYTYDGENRVVSVDGGTTAQYAYDQNNRRCKTTVGSAVTHYVWEGSQVIAEHDGITGAVLVDYVYFGSRMIAKAASGTTQYFLSDRLSARLVLDASGNVLGRQGHLPFGEGFGESGTQQKQHFTSYERDGESELDYAINRGYSTSVGRFTSADPYRESGRMIDPQSLNRYSYGRNDSINNVDPLGLDDQPIKLKGWDCPPGYHSDGDGHCAPGGKTDEYVANISQFASTSQQIFWSQLKQQEKAMRERLAIAAAKLQDIVNNAVWDARQLLEASDECKDAIRGDISREDIVNWFGNLSALGRIHPGPIRDVPARSNPGDGNVPPEIVLSNLFFNRVAANGTITRGVGEGITFPNIPNPKYQPFIILHELAHATRAVVGHSDAQEGALNKRIWEACFAKKKQK